MKKIAPLIVSFLILVGVLFFFSYERHTHNRLLGIILPFEHESLLQIVKGLEEELNLEFNKHITLKVTNAHGDPQLQRALIEQLIKDRCDILIPIGMEASQMTLNLAQNKPVVCLAIDRTLIPSKKNVQATAVDDVVAVHESIAFLHGVFPCLKKITLLYSSSEKIATEVSYVLEAARLEGITIQKLRVQSLSELCSMSKALDPDSELIFILKDNLIVKGIQAVLQQAQKQRLPVMTSDEGSVIAGAAFAIGIKESTIGKQGAQIVKNILHGTPPKEIPPHTIQGPFPLLVNRSACSRQGIDLQTLIQYAQYKRVPIHYVDESIP